MSGIPPDRVGGLWFVSCTQSDRYRHFSRACLELHALLGLPANAFALEMDAGCGGGVHALAHASYLIGGGAADNVLIVASNLPSPYHKHWEAYAQSGAWLSLYIFGDGAGAIVLGPSPSEDRGILATYTAVDPSVPLMSFSRPEGQTETLYRIDGRAVALGFRLYARRAISELQRKFAFSLEQVTRFYFHQVNAKVLRDFLAELEIPVGRAAIHVDRYGNLAAASLFVLLDEDIRSGVIRPGDLCLLCAVGAGAQYGAILLRI
jgi:3-oxoacyl-[acyl-carrier-protein] synthase III